jgi:hypothetical protein
MPRCLSTVAAALALAVPALVCAQIARPMPPSALRGEALFGQPPELAINGQATRLTPGSRIRGLNNMLVLSGTLVGQKGIINYTTDDNGLVVDVWLLRDEEIAQLWPKTREEATTWSYDPLTKTWSKP